MKLNTEDAMYLAGEALDLADVPSAEGRALQAYLTLEAAKRAVLAALPSPSSADEMMFHGGQTVVERFQATALAAVMEEAKLPRGRA